ncbi:MAG: hypothetical protein KDD42_07025, partial [Bdellovibrionales bacterium]|nr:hypothetical protein [Bdellovibrionales bacterium]
MAETSRAIRIWTGSWLSYLLTFSVLAISGLTNPFPLSWGDAFAYLTPAKNLVFRNELVYDNIWTGIAPPLYPALLVPGVAVAQDWSELTKLIALLNSVAFAAIVFPIYGIAKKLGLSN